MAYDVDLAERVRELLAAEDGVLEKAMFGGLAFMVAGRMAVSFGSDGGLMLRVDPSRTESLVQDPRAGRMVMRGREMNGWLLVGVDAGTAAEELKRWIGYGVDYVHSLPPK